MDQEITTKTDQIKQLDDYIRDDEYGERLLVHPEADRRELSKNIIAAKVILRCFPASSIIIREHRLEEGIKNPEYEIDGLLADRKGILSEKGIKWGFISAKRQGCKAIVIDLDDRMGDKPFRANTVAKMIRWRSSDFELGIISRCYVIYNGKSIVIDQSVTDNHQVIEILKKLKP